MKGHGRLGSKRNNQEWSACHHKSRTIRIPIRDANTMLLFLPKYSLDFDRVEKVLAKFGTSLRNPEARVVEAP
jgi:transposase